MSAILFRSFDKPLPLFRFEFVDPITALVPLGPQAVALRLRQAKQVLRLLAVQVRLVELAGAGGLGFGEFRFEIGDSACPAASISDWNGCQVLGGIRG